MRRPLRAGVAAALAAALYAGSSGLLPALVALVPAGAMRDGSLPGGLSLPDLGPTPVAAAAPDLTLATGVRYVVQPERSRVHLVVDITATNRKSDTVTRTYYFENAYLAVLPGTRAFAISSAGVHPSVRVSSATRSYTLLRIGLGKRLYSGQSQRLRLQFDLPDPGGAPTRTVRITPSLVAFPAWAFATADTPGSSVTVVFPAGYDVTARSGTLPASSTPADGTLVFRTGSLARPLAWYVYFDAQKPPALASSSVRTTVGTTPVVVTLRRWADDPAWANRVGKVFRDGLPALSSAIGLPYAEGDPLTVQESTSRASGGYAGLFDTQTRTAEVAYDAEPFVALHEAAHVWFNGSLLADRWANEGFASWYAADVAGDLDIAPRVEPLTPTLAASAVPLNAWGAVGAEKAAVDDYGYAASTRLAGLIAERAGPGVLSAVWAAAAAREAPYQPVAPGAPREALAATADWRTLLDLLEEKTGIDYADLWAKWVVRPADAQLLAQRAAARSHYIATLRAAGDWELPAAIRAAMDGWRFDEADRLLDDADAALAAWSALRSLAQSHGLTPPDATRRAFGGRGGPAAAGIEIAAETAAIAEIDAAEADARLERGIFGSIGLIGEVPAAEVSAARSAYEAGDLAEVARRTASARAIWAGADDMGRRRVAAAAFAVLVIGGTLVIVVAAFRRRRREPVPVPLASRFAAQAHPLAGTGPIAGRRPLPGSEPLTSPPSGTGAAHAGAYDTLGSGPGGDQVPTPRPTERAVDERGGSADVTAGTAAADPEVPR